MADAYALYTASKTSSFAGQNVNGLLSFGNSPIIKDAVLFHASNLGKFPFAGPHEILRDSNYLRDHMIKTEKDALARVLSRSYDGIIIVDYSRFWLPDFDWSEYESGSGLFTDSDFDIDVGCSDADLYNPRDRDYREDFYNWFYCNEQDRIQTIIDNQDDGESESLEQIMRAEWNAVSRKFYEITIMALRTVLPRARIGFFNAPYAIYKDERLAAQAPNVFGYGTRGLGKIINDNLSWLYSSVDLICPYLSAQRYTIENSKTPQVGIENTKAQNEAYLRNNMQEAQRIASRHGKEVFPILGHFYQTNNKPPYHRQPISLVNKTQQYVVATEENADGIFFYATVENATEQAQIEQDYSQVNAIDDPTGESRGGAFGTPGGSGGTEDAFDPATGDASVSTDDSIGGNNLVPIGGVNRNAVRIYPLWEDEFVSVSGRTGSFVEWWESNDGVSNLITRMNRDYNTGFRRFMLYLPGGTSTNDSLKSPNQWFTMSETRRTQLTSQLGSWITNHDDAVVGVFAGPKIEQNLDKLSTHEIDFDSASIYDLINESLDAEYFRQNFEGWYNMGIRDFFFAEVSPSEYDDFTSFAMSSYLLDRKALNQGLPMDNGEVDEGFISNFPWFISFEKYRSLRAGADWDFSTSRTEVGVVFSPNQTFVADEITALQNEGIVFYTTEGWQDSFVQDTAGVTSDSSDSDDSSSDTYSFEVVNTEGSDPIEGFGLPRYDPGTAIAVGQNDGEDYADLEVVAIANSIDGTFELATPLNKYTRVEVDILNPSFINTSFPHWTIEDQFEWVNSGMPSHLSQVAHSNLMTMGVNLTRTNPNDMARVPPYQARYIVPCNRDFYDSFNSTVDYELSKDSGNKGLSIPYPTSVVHIPSLGEVWVGGQGGVISIDDETYEVQRVTVDSRRELLIKDIFVRGDTAYILDEKGLYTINLVTMSVTRDAGLGLPNELFEVTSLLNTNLVIGASDGVYAKKTTQDEWQRVIETSEPVDVIIAPDAVFAIRRVGSNRGSNSEVYYSVDGFNWTNIGNVGSRVVNSIVKFRNKIYVATDNGIYDDNGNFYAERASIRLNNVFNDAAASREIIANDITSNLTRVVAGLSDGRYVVVDDLGFAVGETNLDAIHKVLLVDNAIWVFGYDLFQVVGTDLTRRLVTGISLASQYQ